MPFTPPILSMSHGRLRRRWQDFIVNRKAVQAQIREMGIAGIVPGPNLSQRNIEHRIYPYLLRNLKVDTPEPSVGHQYHLHPAATRLVVSGGGAGLVLPLRAQLGTRSDARNAVCAGGGGNRLWRKPTLKSGTAIRVVTLPVPNTPSSWTRRTYRSVWMGAGGRWTTFLSSGSGAP